MQTAQSTDSNKKKFDRLSALLFNLENDDSRQKINHPSNQYVSTRFLISATVNRHGFVNSYDSMCQTLLFHQFRVKLMDWLLSLHSPIQTKGMNNKRKEKLLNSLSHPQTESFNSEYFLLKQTLQ